jgi:hypothetical protein
MCFGKIGKSGLSTSAFLFSGVQDRIIKKTIKINGKNFMVSCFVTKCRGFI